MKIKTNRRLQTLCAFAFVGVAATVTDYRHWQWWLLLALYVVDNVLHYGEGMDRGGEIVKEVWGIGRGEA